MEKIKQRNLRYASYREVSGKSSWPNSPRPTYPYLMSPEHIDPLDRSLLIVLLCASTVPVCGERGHRGLIPKNGTQCQRNQSRDLRRGTPTETNEAATRFCSLNVDTQTTSVDELGVFLSLLLDCALKSGTCTRRLILWT